MEKLEINKLFGGIYSGKRVLVTGHTGFKGSWLALWLEQMGAEVYGLALEPPTQPNHFNLLNLRLKSNIADINDLEKVSEIIRNIDPEIIFHLAAQPIVRLSYDDPLGTLATNIIGTANILEVSRNLPGLKALIVITSDKCYDNKEWVYGYREHEAMGGKDPYSASKGCAEIITSAYRHSFFNKSNSALIASARAGNVIGGGDWAKDRILTDIVISASRGEKVYLRFPHATRPWQYVLEPLSGYLTLGWQLLKNETKLADAWNFGPFHESNLTVLELVMEARKNWNKIDYDIDVSQHPHEAGLLMLDSAKAIRLLKWKPVWGFQNTIEQTIHWYKRFYENDEVISKTILINYIMDARKMQLPWSLT